MDAQVYNVLLDEQAKQIVGGVTLEDAITAVIETVSKDYGCPVFDDRLAVEASLTRRVVLLWHPMDTTRETTRARARAQRLIDALRDIQRHDDDRATLAKQLKSSGIGWQYLNGRLEILLFKD